MTVSQGEPRSHIEEGTFSQQPGVVPTWLRSTTDPRPGFVLGNTFEYKPVQYSALDGIAIFEGDIALGTVEYMEKYVGRPEAALADQLERERERTGGEEGLIIKSTLFRWPRGVIPYEIDPNLPNPARVKDAIHHWEERTRIRFVLRTPENEYLYPDYVRFEDRGECFSRVGRQGGMQVISLGDNCSTGNAIHEIGHTVGLWHEQSRADRDNFVTVLWENIDQRMRHNFDQHITDGDDVGEYDYGSIMHYPSLAFSKNGNPTIVTKQGQAIGQREALSEGDIAAVHAMYPVLQAPS